ncbi:hypothetical protein EQJ94_26250 [Escherichia coli]|nr:hypothetical protein [Escherichia coli]
MTMNTFDMIDMYAAVIVIIVFSVVGCIAIENNCKTSVLLILVIQAVIAYIVLSWVFFRSFTI